MIVRYFKIFLLFFAVLALPEACSEIEVQETPAGDAVEMPGIDASMTKTVSVVDLKDYVGKKEFANNDIAVFTYIHRTGSVIPQFTYYDIQFKAAVSTEGGVTSVAWSRVKNTGTYGGGSGSPERIYWTDATNPHTFVGYCVPQQRSGTFDWNKSSESVYYGSIGDPSASGEIDFRSTYDGSGAETLSGNVVLCENDILLSHATDVVASDGIAQLHFHHGLAQVRVIVNISDYAAQGAADKMTVVSDMKLKDMLTMYKWRQTTSASEALASDDQTVIEEWYSPSVSYDQKKDFMLWIPAPGGVGTGAGKTFTFYGLAVPTDLIPQASPLQFSFRVKYPDPMFPNDRDKDQTKTYSAQIYNIKFDAGKCTTINIALNHRDEKITVGAEYFDWEFIDTPDQGELKKNSTFLSSTARYKSGGTTPNVTIFGDATATADDATWLYVDPTSEKILDIYGNDGTPAKPFQISTADQLLSFAYEVKGTGRQAVTYTGLDSASHPLAAGAGFDFTGYTVSLDAGITLQASIAKTKQEMNSSDEGYSSAPDALSWIGIGADGKPFNGDFKGGVRLVSRLYGSPFFVELGPKAHAEQLILEDVISISGDGGFAHLNRGVICACKVDGDVTSDATESPVGSFVGTNRGLVFACYHVGSLTATSASVVGGLIGSNDGTGAIVASYNYGKITGKSSGTTYGVLGQYVPASSKYENYATVYGCFYDSVQASGVTEVAPSNTLSSDYPSSGKTTAEIMKSTFSGAQNSTDKSCLNGIINTWPEGFKKSLEDRGQNPEHFKSHYYVPQPASYPYVY